MIFAIYAIIGSMSMMVLSILVYNGVVADAFDGAKCYSLFIATRYVIYSKLVIRYQHLMSQSVCLTQVDLPRDCRQCEMKCEMTDSAKLNE